MKKTLLVLLFVSAAVVAFAAETAPLNYIRNSNFAEGRKHWVLHKCKFDKNQVVFDHTQETYTQMWQIVLAKPASGSKVRFEVDAKVTDPNGLLKQKGAFTRLQLIFKGADKKSLSIPSEKGMALPLADTAGEYKTFSIVYTVPEGTEVMTPLTIVKNPVRVEVKAVRLLQLN